MVNWASLEGKICIVLKDSGFNNHIGVAMMASQGRKGRKNERDYILRPRRIKKQLR